MKALRSVKMLTHRLAVEWIKGHDQRLP